MVIDIPIQFGLVFDTRWPSKRFKHTRRFCYVQFVDPAAARAAAASLHGHQLDPLTRLSVLVSDPNRKQTRSDAHANDRELFVGGLSKFVKEAELRRLFEQHGAVVGVRMGVNEDGTSKGHAFVEFAEEGGAKGALKLDGHELKKRKMAVSLAEKRQVGVVKVAGGGGEVRPAREEVVGRMVVVRGFESGVEEAVVQQAVEKVLQGVEGARVVRVNMDRGATDATVELESEASAGRVLLACATKGGKMEVGGREVDVGAKNAPAVGGMSRAERRARERGEGGGGGGTGGGAAGAGAGAGAGGEGGGPLRTGGPLVPRTARGRGKVGGLGAGRGRGGLGFGVARGAVGGSASAPAPVVEGGSAPAAGPKGQDYFRALMEGK